MALGRLEVETADHVILRYDLAGAGSRILAAVLDFLIASLLVFALAILWVALRAFVPQRLWEQLVGLVGLVTLLFIWLYFIVLEWIWNGQTIGKRASGLRVIGEDGRPAGFVAILVRNVARLVDFLPAFYAIGFVAVVLSSRSQRLGDLAAGTFVVRAPRPRLDAFALRTIDRAAASARPVAAGIDVRRLSGETQRLVREVVVREAKLSKADRDRVLRPLAAHLRARLPDVTEPDDLALVRAVASALRASGETVR